MAGLAPAPPAITGHLLPTMIERALHHPDWLASRPHDTDNRIMEALIDVYIGGIDPERDCSAPVLSDPVMRAAKFMETTGVKAIEKAHGRTGGRGNGGSFLAGLNMVYRGLPISTVGTPIPFSTVTW